MSDTVQGAPTETGCPACGCDEIRWFITSDRGKVYMCLGCGIEVQPLHSLDEGGEDE